jgi:integrase/recombinase XerD
VRLTEAIDAFVEDQFATGRFNSPHTEKGYRRTLVAFAEDTGNRDPRKTNRDDIKRTLGRWSGNTRALCQAHLVSFHDWLMEEGLRKDNPARQVRRTKRRRPVVYRMTRSEVRAFRSAAQGDREVALADLGLLAGLRLQELQGMQGRHFRREGWVWVSADIGKGNKERWVPVLPELAPTWQRIAEHVADSDYVLPQGRGFWAAYDYVYRTDASEPMSVDSIRRLVGVLAKRAGIRANVTPHTLRHAYGDHVARFAGIKVAQYVLGHANVGTTQGYTGEPTMDEITAALDGFGYGSSSLPAQDQAANAPVQPAAGFRVEPSSRDVEPNEAARALSFVLRELYMNPEFRAAAKAVA